MHDIVCYTDLHIVLWPESQDLRRRRLARLPVGAHKGLVLGHLDD